MITPAIEVFDISKPTATFVKSIALAAASPVPQIVKNLNKMFVPESSGKVEVIDVNPASATFNTVIDSFDAGGKPLDGVEYIPGLNKLYCLDNQDGILVVVDLATNKIIKTITGLGTNIEPAQYNPNDKMVYMPNQNDNVVFKYDPQTDTQVSKTDIGDKLTPSHFAIKPGSDIAVLGSMNTKPEHIVTWDFKANKIASVINDVGQVDFVIYDPVVDLFFGASGKWSGGSCIAILDGNGKFLTNVLTGDLGGHSVAFDETNYIVYTVDRDMTPTPPIQICSFPLSKTTKRPMDAPPAPTTAPTATTPAVPVPTITWRQVTDPQFQNKIVTITGPCIGTVNGHDPSLVLGTAMPEDPLTTNVDANSFMVGMNNPRMWADLKALQSFVAAQGYVGKQLSITAALIKNPFTDEIEFVVFNPSKIVILGPAVPETTTTAPAATTTVPAATTTAPAGLSLTWDQALLPANSKKTATVTGVCIEVLPDWTTHLKVVLGKADPDGFPVLMYDPTLFPDPTLQSWVGKTLAITGKIVPDSRNKDMPAELIVQTADQVQVLP